MRPYDPSNDEWDGKNNNPDEAPPPDDDGYCQCPNCQGPRGFRDIWSFELLGILLEERTPEATDLESEQELIEQAVRMTDNLIRKLEEDPDFDPRGDLDHE